MRALCIAIVISFCLGRWLATPRQWFPERQVPGQWTCSMHPAITEERPGHCPVCGMDLVERSVNAATPQSRNRVSLSASAVRAMAISTARVSRVGAAQLERTFFGTVQNDQVKLSVEPSDSAWVAVGNWAFVRADGDTQSYSGRVVAVESTGVTVKAPGAPSGMFVQASVRQDTSPWPPMLAISSSAVLPMGRRALVYVDVGGGASDPTYEARIVRLGARVGDTYAVQSGLLPDERVVISGVQSLDAELQLRGGNAMATLADDWQRRPDDQSAVPPVQLRPALQAVVDHGVAVYAALLAGNLGNAREAAKALRATSRSIRPGTDWAWSDTYLATYRRPGARVIVHQHGGAPAPGSESAAVKVDELPLPELPFFDAWMHVAFGLEARARQMSMARDLDSARRALRGLTLALIDVLAVVGNPGDTPLVFAVCPTLLPPFGAPWMQRPGPLRNPYAPEDDCAQLRFELPGRQMLPAGALAFDKPVRR